MKAISGKCYLITNKQSCVNLKIGNTNTENKQYCEKLLGVRVDNKISFNEHLHGIIKIVSCKFKRLI